MGLPLFVARVQDEHQPKSALKGISTSPSRTSIRRVDNRSSSRDSRTGARRPAVRIYGPVQRSLSTINQDRPLPWVESGFPPDRSANPADYGPAPMREALRDMTRLDRRRRDRLEAQMNAILPDGLPELPAVPQREEERPDSDLGWWSLDPRQRARRARLVPGIATRFTRSPDIIDHMRPRNSPPANPEEHLRTFASSVMGAQRRNPDPRSITRVNPSRRGVTTRRVVDGLGDRERSLSPEGWDTLLTTLTPDPQPPSANSSFASGAPLHGNSQGSGQTSGATTLVPEGIEDGPLLDAQCDSGCEHSDMDDADYEHPDYAQIRRRREELRRVSRVASARSINRQPTPNSRRGPDGADSRPSQERPAPGTVLFADGPGQRDAWIGRVLIGSAEEERETDGPASTTQESSSSAPNGAGEEDWSGMQRIVRRLARREDIPDEWWAEAGLSRTLSREESG